MDDVVPMGGQEYWVLLALLVFGRAMDFLSTWVATPNLVLEGNPLAKMLGWRWGLVVNVVLVACLARWPLSAIVVATASVLVAARNFQSAWLMRSLGEETYRAWHVERIQETPILLYLLCLAGNTLLTAGVGAGLMYFGGWRLVPLAIGMGMVAYAVAVAFYTLLSVWRARRLKPLEPTGPMAPAPGLIRLLWLAPWVALLAFMAKVGSYENARQLAPYYVFFFPLLLVAAGHVQMVRERWWRRMAGLVMLVTLGMVVSLRGTPLFPAQTLLGWLREKYPNSQALLHAQASFSSANTMQLQRHCFQSDLPPDEKVIGYYSTIFGVAEPGCWQPFGIRRVERVLPGDTRDYVRSLNLHYVIVDEEALRVTHQTLADWLQKYEGELVAQVVFTIRWGLPPTHLYLARLP